MDIDIDIHVSGLWEVTQIHAEYAVSKFNLIYFNINIDANRQCRVIQLNVKGKPTHTVAEIIIWFPAEFVSSFTKK